MKGCARPAYRLHSRVVTTAALALALSASPVAGLVCAGYPYADPPDPALAGLLDRAAPLLARYPSLAEGLSRMQPDLCLSDTPSEALGYFEPASNRVVIDAGLDPDLSLVIFLHELRHVEQYARGLCPDLSLAMSAYARATWALEADATTITLIAAWDLRQSGDPGPWGALQALPRYRGVADAFASEMQATGDLARAGEAAFAGWYEHAERREAYYIAGCSAYLEAQERAHAIPQYGAIDPSFFQDLCVLPDGTRFDCAEPRLD